VPQSIFVNLPVKDLDRSAAFFTTLGFSFNAQFTDATGACMVISDTIYVMLLTHTKFAAFTPRRIADATKETERLIALNRESRADVDALIEKALSAGGGEPRAAQDHGFMYGRAFEDPDGHIWEVFWMDPSFVQPTG
jgi:uncharacterized protein